MEIAGQTKIFAEKPDRGLFYSFPEFCNDVCTSIRLFQTFLFIAESIKVMGRVLHLRKNSLTVFNCTSGKSILGAI